MEELRIRIRWRDIDALGHVNNAVYLTYLEELLNAFLAPALGVEWVTARTELDFRREVRLSDEEVVARASVSGRERRAAHRGADENAARC